MCGSLELIYSKAVAAKKGENLRQQLLQNLI